MKYVPKTDRKLRTLDTRELSLVTGSEGTPMPAARRGLAPDGTPMPAARRGMPPDGTPIPA